VIYYEEHEDHEGYFKKYALAQFLKKMFMFVVLISFIFPISIGSLIMFFQI